MTSGQQLRWRYVEGPQCWSIKPHAGHAQQGTRMQEHMCSCWAGRNAYHDVLAVFKQALLHVKRASMHALVRPWPSLCSPAGSSSYSDCNSMTVAQPKWGVQGPCSRHWGWWRW